MIRPTREEESPRRSARRAAHASAGRVRRLPRALLALVLCSAALGLACSQERGAPEAELPESALLAGDAPAFARLLRRLEGLEGTPVARAAREMGQRLAGCEEFSARAAAGSLGDLAANLRCEAFAEQPPAVRALRGEGDDWVFVLPVGEGGRVAGALRSDAQGSVELSARLDPPPGSGITSLILPGADAPGEPTLSGDDALLQLRLRPEGGLDVASLIPAGSQADSLFRLKSELFLGSVLGESWELGVYMPLPGSVTPPMALAVDVSLRAAAVAAMEKFIGELEATWPIHHISASLSGFEGACFPDLRILPGFAPCYVATPRSLVIGWNAASVVKALSTTNGEAEARAPRAISGSQSALVLHLDRLPEADRRLREVLGSEAAAHPTDAIPIDYIPTDYIWERLLLESVRGEKGYELRARLQSRAAS